MNDCSNQKNLTHHKQSALSAFHFLLLSSYEKRGLELANIGHFIRMQPRRFLTIKADVQK